MKTKPVMFINLPRQHRALKKALLSGIGKTLDSAHFILGPETQALEQEVAGLCRARYAYGLNSGTDALILALRAMDIGPGDEVIVPDFTFVATATAVMLAGAVPVLADIDSATFHLDLKAVEAAVTKKTKAIIPVHLYGQPVAMTPLMTIARKYNLKVIEDAAQAIGATEKGKPVGALGHVGCFSFFPTKNLGGIGDGGMVVTNHADVAKRLNRLRQHGADRKYYHDELGLNSRLDEIQSAALRIKLPLLNAWNERRLSIAQAYNQAFADLPLRTPLIRKGCTHVFHQYALLVEQRDSLQQHLAKHQIGSAVHYPLPLHRQPLLLGNPSAARAFPVSERVAQQVLCLPIVPETTDSQVRTVIHRVREFFGKK